LANSSIPKYFTRADTALPSLPVGIRGLNVLTPLPQSHWPTVLHMSTADAGGGAWDAAYRIHRSLLAADVRSYMCVASKKRDDPSVLRTSRSRFAIRALATIESRVVRLSFSTPNPYLHSAALFSCHPLTAIRSLKPDIVQLTWINGGFMTPEDVGRIEVPIVWRLADMWPFCGAEHFVTDSDRYQMGYLTTNRDPRERGIDLNRWVWERKRTAYAKANLTIVAPSHWIASLARKSALFSNRRIDVIPTGVDDDVFWPEPAGQARARFGIASDKFVLITAASSFNDVRKGVDDLRQLFLALASAGLADRVHVITAGKHGSEAFSNVVLPMTNLGYVRDSSLLRQAYSVAHLNICTSKHDNLPNTILEATACGCPTAAYDVGGVADAVGDGVSGFLFRPDDLAGLIRCVIEAVGSPTTVLEARAACVRHHLAHFTLARQAASFRKLYEDLLDHPRSSAAVGLAPDRYAAT
jgi:glycosyltransferase involved in cell wall biosynthesis